MMMFQMFKDITDDTSFIILKEEIMKKMDGNKTNACG